MSIFTAVDSPYSWYSFERVVIMCMCNPVLKGHLRNDRYCVRRDIKPYSLTHSSTVSPTTEMSTTVSV